ncbi:MAG: KpsF/GutQ family sugar-phosphate isomerase [Victivallales bacterium]|nr:KpsF/GutQ family sugar-phosphate isomerase [Victivallales bacterium]
MRDIIKRASEVFDIEIEGLEHVKDHLDGGFTALVESCCEVLENGGKIVVSGIGKSGYIGRKIAATLSSTGSTAVFMHPVEAMHGDLGVLDRRDILLALSYSGETEELLQMLPSAKRLDIKTAALTGVESSRLAGWADIKVVMPVRREACPFNLAPTTTTTALLALGDALAMVLLDIRGFSKDDYGRLHPGGAIGRAVTLRVRDIMRTGDRLVTVSPETTVKDALLAMTRGRSGSAIVTGKKGELLGIFTDGDFRRHVEKDLEVLTHPVGDVMTETPSYVLADNLAVEILKLLEKRHIDDIIVVDDTGKVIGMVDIQDLPGLKLM